MNMAWAIPGAVQAGTSLAEYFGRRRKPSFAGSSYGRLLKKRSDEGIYSPSARRNLLSLTGSALGQTAQSERENIRGRLINSGMGRSIAGTRAIAEPGRQRMRSLSDYARKIDIENELAKREAEDRYAQAEFGYEDQRQREGAGSRRNLLSGLAGAAAAGYGGYMRQKDQDARNQYYSSRANKYEQDAANAVSPDWSTASEDEVLEWATRNLKPEQVKLYIWQYLQATEGE